MIVASDPDDRKELTRLVRDELRQRGKLSGEAHTTITVSAQKDVGTGRLANRYARGDMIGYRTGSADLGIADHSEATVLRVDPSTNRLTVATLDGNEVSYNPALTRKMTQQSNVFRAESRDVTVGDRIRFTRGSPYQKARAGDFATIEQIGADKTLTIRRDNGRSLQLPPGQSKGLDHGYAVEGIRQASVQRVLISRDESQIGTQAKAMKNLSGNTHDVTVFSSAGQDPAGRGKQTLKKHGTPKIGVSMGRAAVIDTDGIGIGR